MKKKPTLVGIIASVVFMAIATRAGPGMQYDVGSGHTLRGGSIEAWRIIRDFEQRYDTGVEFSLDEQLAYAPREDLGGKLYQ